MYKSNNKKAGFGDTAYTPCNHSKTGAGKQGFGDTSMARKKPAKGKAGQYHT